MRTFLMILCAAMSLLLLLCSCAAAEDAPEDAIEMSRRMGNGINLGNTMEACNNRKRRP